MRKETKNNARAVVRLSDHREETTPEIVISSGEKEDGVVERLARRLVAA